MSDYLLRKHIQKELDSGIPIEKLYHYYQDKKHLCECDNCKGLAPEFFIKKLNNGMIIAEKRKSLIPVECFDTIKPGIPVYG